jgi:hypothetical protein
MKKNLYIFLVLVAIGLLTAAVLSSSFSNREGLTTSSTTNKARYIKVAYPSTKVEYIQLSQLAVYSNSVNVAIGKTTTSSTPYSPESSKDKAVDGTLAERPYPNMFHSMNTADAFWQVDLGQEYPIDSVVYYNRKDCCYDRSAGLLITLMDKNNAVVKTFTCVANDMVQTFQMPVVAAAATTAATKTCPTGQVLNDMNTCITPTTTCLPGTTLQANKTDCCPASHIYKPSADGLTAKCEKKLGYDEAYEEYEFQKYLREKQLYDRDNSYWQSRRDGLYGNDDDEEYEDANYGSNYRSRYDEFQQKGTSSYIAPGGNTVIVGGRREQRREDSRPYKRSSSRGVRGKSPDRMHTSYKASKCAETTPKRDKDRECSRTTPSTRIKGAQAPYSNEPVHALGTEDKYMLKTQLVPPVCPTYPGSGVNGASAASSTTSTTGAPIPPCPACERCPEPAFDCKKVPNYSSTGNGRNLPQPVLADFSGFGM